MSTVDDEFRRLVLESEEGKIVQQIDFTQLIFQQIRLCQFVGIQGEKEVFADSVMLLLSMIPRMDWDEPFKQEIKNCQFEYKVATGSYISDLTHDVQREIVIDDTDYDYMQLLHAIINLLRRKGTLWQERQIEVM